MFLRLSGAFILKSQCVGMPKSVRNPLHCCGCPGFSLRFHWAAQAKFYFSPCNKGTTLSHYGFDLICRTCNWIFLLDPIFCCRLCVISSGESCKMCASCSPAAFFFSQHAGSRKNNTLIDWQKPDVYVCEYHFILQKLQCFLCSCGAAAEERN